MKTGIVINSKEFELAIEAGARDLGKALPEMYRDELGRLGKDLINIRTPPKNRSQGIKRVRGQILNTCTPVNEKWLNVLERQYGSQNAAGTYRSKRGEVIRFAYSRIVRTMSELHRLHKLSRSRTTGRNKYQPTNTYYTPTKPYVSKALYAKYVKFMQRGVGMAKGGWWRAFRQVYTQRPPASWITNKIGQGASQVDLRVGFKQTFIATNRSPWAGRTSEAKAAVVAAMRNRSKTIPVAVAREISRAMKKHGFYTKPTPVPTLPVTN